MQPDFAKIDRNINRLIQQNAPDEDLAAYLSSEGVTAEQVSQWKEGQQSPLTRIGHAVSGAANYVVDAMSNKSDPAYEGLPTLITAPNSPLAPHAFEAAKLTATNDDGLANIAKQKLGASFIRTEKDRNGFPVIVYRGTDGAESKAYINQPHWDMQDIDRALGGGLPYALTGGLVGGAMKGAGVVANMVGQAFSGALTSVGQDVAADQMGADQGVSGLKAAGAAVGGAVGEGVGAFVGNLLRKRAAHRSLVGADGKLTDRGRREAQRLGFDPDEINGELAEHINAEMLFAKNPAEAITAPQTDRFGIPTTRGQRTNRPSDVLDEKDLRSGLYGERAQKQIEAFDADQERRIREAAWAPQRGRLSPNAREGIAEKLSGRRRAYEDLDISGYEAGESVREQFRIAQKNAKATERAAWDKVTDIRPKQQAFQSLPGILQQEMPFIITPKLHPAATEMVGMLEKYIKGEKFAPPSPDLLGPGRSLTLDQMRRELGGKVADAAPGGDKTAASAIYRAFNKWIDDSAEKALIQGDVDAAKALRDARSTTKEIKSLFQPRFADGLKKPAARILEQITKADTPEGVIDVLLGRARTNTRLPTGAYEALKRYKDILTKHGGPEAMEAWNDIRVMHWLRMLQPDRHRLGLQTGAMRSGIESAFEKRNSLMILLYTPEERRLMMDFARALDIVTYRDPNPSGSGSVVRKLFPNLVKDSLQVQSKRELFSKNNVFASRIYRSLAQVLPDLLGGKVPGAVQANRALSQTIAQKPLPSLGGYGAAVGGQQPEAALSPFDFAGGMFGRGS